MTKVQTATTYLRTHLWELVIGVGLALSPIHNVWLTTLVTKEGEVGFFLPAFGTAIWLIGSLFFVVDNWKRLDWGDRRVYIPLLVIVGAIALSGLTADSFGGVVSPLLTGLSLFALYLTAKMLGKEIFFPLAIGTAIASLGIIIHSGINHEPTGGYVFENNFDIATGYILLGMSLFFHRWRWILAGLSVVALLFSGAPEAIFVMGVLGTVVLLRKDWSKKLVAIGGVLLLLIAVGLISGKGQDLYWYAASTVKGEPAAFYETPEGVVDKASPLVMRGRVIRDALTAIRPLGEGYNLTGYTVHTVHNVPLVIVQQLGWPGVVAGLAWLWVVVYCLVKTRWKYSFSLILALSVFDHFVWSQLAPILPALIGASTAANNIETDLIFRNPKPKA